MKNLHAFQNGQKRNRKKYDVKSKHLKLLSAYRSPKGKWSKDVLFNMHGRAASTMKGLSEKYMWIHDSHWSPHLVFHTEFWSSW